MPMKLQLILDETSVGGRRYYRNEQGDIVDHQGQRVPCHEEINVRLILRLTPIDLLKLVP